MAKNQARIEERTSKIIVPHEGKDITFAYPSVGMGNYRDIGTKILKNGQAVPTGDYTASLIHAAYCNEVIKDELEFEEIRKIMKYACFSVFNQILWTKDGVYVVPDVNAIGRKPLLNQSELEEMLKGSKEFKGVRFSKDNKVRFVPKGSYKLGEHTSESLAKDGFVIASYGVEGAEKLGEVSSKFMGNPCTHGFETNIVPEQGVSVLLAGNLGYKLDVVGNGLDVDEGEYAFGVLK